MSYLAERGHRNDLLTHPDGRLFQQSQALSVRTIPLVVRNDLDLRPVPRLRRLIRDENYDIIHFHTKRAHALSFWLSHGAPRPKYVVTRRMDYPEANNWYTRCLYNRKVEGVVAMSRKIFELLVQAGVEAEKIRLIHDGIDPRPFESACKYSRTCIPSALWLACAAVLRKEKAIVSYWKRRSDSRLKVADFNTASPVTGR